MEIWVDNEKAWRLVQEYAKEGLSDAVIAKKLYRDHGLVSMRGRKPYGAGAVWALRKNGKPKRNICVFVRHKGSKSEKSAKPAKADKRVERLSVELDLAGKILGMDVDSETKLELMRKVLG